MGTITALSLLCLAASIFSCATLETETLSSDERLKREENVLEVDQQSELSQKKKSTTTVEQLADEVEQLRRSLRSLEDRGRTNSLNDKLRNKRDTSAGSTFVRWGEKSCPYGTSEVYVGVVGGKWYDQKGSGTNYLCLTKSPQLESFTASSWGEIFGTEYEYIRYHHNHDVPCSVCRVPKSTTIMVPGTRSCPSGWTRQYYGYLVSNHVNFYATEYVCLDRYPDNEDHGHEDKNGALFSHVVSKCGSLVCPPYHQNGVMTCAVCSK